VYELTGSTVAVGLIGLCELVPLLLLSLLGGTLADAFDRRRLLMITEVLTAACSGGLAYNATLDEPSLALVYALTTAIAALYALGSPAFRSLTPLLVPREELPAAVALSGVSDNLSSVIGPTIAGFMLASLGLAWTYMIDVATFAATLMAVWAMRPVPPAEDAQRPGLRAVLEGLRFLKGKPVLRASFVVDIIAMVFGMSNALFPAVARSLGGPEVLGLLYAAPSAGALGASLFSGWIGRVHRHGVAVYIAVAGWGGALIVFGLSDTMWLTLVALTAAGAADLISAIFREAILLTATPKHMVGRLSGLELTVVASGPALGDLEAGVLAAVVGVRSSIVIGGIACIAGVVLMAVLSPAFAAYDAREPTP
jgi:MFS family permease